MSNGYYTRNKSCSCARCRVGGLMAAAVLITIGLLALLHQFYGVRAEKFSPLLLIVIGVVLLLGRTASTEGHIQPYGVPLQPRVDAQDPWASGRTTTPASTLQPSEGPPPSSEQQNDQQVKP
jgi:hypothetical protein